MLTSLTVRVPTVPTTCEVCAVRGDGEGVGAAADAELAANIAATPAPSMTAVALAMMLLFMVHLLEIGARLFVVAPLGDEPTLAEHTPVHPQPNSRRSG